MARRVWVGILAGIGFLVLVDAVAARLGVARGLTPAVEGPSAWITSRAAGVTAFVALTIELLFGLFISTGAADRVIPRARTVEIHRWLSSIVLAFIAVHALVLTADRTIRLDVLDALVPFVSPYRSFAVALGVLSAYAAVTLHVSFFLRRRIGAKTWRKLHFLSFFVFAAALAHGVFSGSDSASTGMRALYVSSATLVASLASYRVLTARTKGVNCRRSSAPAARLAKPEIPPGAPTES